jgi:hypothetical protein
MSDAESLAANNESATGSLRRIIIARTLSSSGASELHEQANGVIPFFASVAGKFNRFNLRY